MSVRCRSTRSTTRQRQPKSGDTSTCYWLSFSDGTPAGAFAIAASSFVWRSVWSASFPRCLLIEFSVVPNQMKKSRFAINAMMATNLLSLLFGLRLRPAPVWIRGHLLAFAPHERRVRHGKNLPHAFVEAAECLRPLDALRQLRCRVDIHMSSISLYNAFSAKHFLAD
jgi:hypothetical protein